MTSNLRTVAAPSAEIESDLGFWSSVFVTSAYQVVKRKTVIGHGYLRASTIVFGIALILNSTNVLEPVLSTPDNTFRDELSVK